LAGHSSNQQILKGLCMFGTESYLNVVSSFCSYSFLVQAVTVISNNVAMCISTTMHRAS